MPESNPSEIGGTGLVLVGLHEIVRANSLHAPR